MKRAEQVTFGGGGLERAAHLRTDTAALEAAWNSSEVQVLLMWRGKPLTRRAAEGDLPCGLAWTLPSHPLAADRKGDAIYLGQAPGGTHCFACDISDWQPQDLDQDALNSFADASEQQHPELPDTHVFAELRRIMTRLTPLEAELSATAKALLAWHRSHRFCACCGAPSDMAQAGWQRVCPSCKTP
ncbi:NUDIX-like domain-containing protein, partial [Leisingera sp. ANG-DT]|uniref:NUDIX-like domain-containing protein n=1 Tax=Leisingera sp. ANG-DT TaxID=1577897 RepID=UPI003159DEE7